MMYLRLFLTSARPFSRLASRLRLFARLVRIPAARRNSYRQSIHRVRTALFGLRFTLIAAVIHRRSIAVREYVA